MQFFNNRKGETGELGDVEIEGEKVSIDLSKESVADISSVDMMQMKSGPGFVGGYRKVS